MRRKREIGHGICQELRLMSRRKGLGGMVVFISRNVMNIFFFKDHNPLNTKSLTLRRWINQVETYFQLTKLTDKADRVGMISLLVDGKASDWWEDRKHKYST